MNKKSRETTPVFSIQIKDSANLKQSINIFYSCSDRCSGTEWKPAIIIARWLCLCKTTKA